MARRFGYRRRVRTRRRPFRRSFGTNRAMRGYRRPTRMELKLRDYSSPTAVPVTGSPIILPMNGITVGSNFWNRMGSRISMKSLYFKLLFLSNGAYTGPGAGTTPVYRFSLVYDKHNKGVTPNVADIWAQVDGSGSLSSGITSSTNPLGRDRFVILWDKIMVVRSDAAGEAATFTGRNAMIKKYMKLKNSEALYNTGNTGGISDIESGALFFIAQCDKTTAQSPFAIYLNSRLRWTD